jgi:hypothetical protein
MHVNGEQHPGNEPEFNEEGIFYNLQENADELWKKYVEAQPDLQQLLDNLNDSPYVQYALSHLGVCGEEGYHVLRNTLLLSLTFLGIKTTVKLLKESAHGFATEGSVTYFTLSNLPNLQNLSIKFSVLSSLIGGVSEMASPKDPKSKALELVEKLVDDKILKSTLEKFFREQIEFTEKTFH